MIHLLTEASELFATSLDYERTLTRVAELAVPRIADWCAVDIVNPEGGIERLAVAHVDPAKIQWAKEIAVKFPTNPNAPTGVPQVIRTGKSEFYPEVSQALVDAANINEEQRILLAKLGLSSVMIVPLKARTIVLGAITFVMAESGRHFADSDLLLAEDLGRLGGLAVDNAWLYRKSQEEVEDRKQVEDALRISETRFRTMIEQSPLGIQVFDLDGNCVDANRAWEELWYASREELRDYNIRRDPQLEARGVKPYIERAFGGEAVALPTVYYDPAENGKPGRPRWIRSFMYPVKDDAQHVREVAVILEDVTERRKANEELREAKERAETNERELEIANQAKDRFLAILSHELRTPLTPILATVEALREEKIPDEFRPWLDIIQRNVELEARLIDDLLDLTRISKGKLQLDRNVVDLHGLLESVVDMYRIEIVQKGIRIEIELKAHNHYVVGDPARLQQIFWNLIKNSEKFTPSGGTISIRSSDVSLEPKDEHAEHSERIRIEIMDTGIGIEPELLPRIFEAFEQGGTSTRTFGGLGLGLAISKSLVEAHGGTIYAESPGKNRGAMFTVEFITAPKPNTSAISERVESISTSEKKPTILLVDDHSDTSAAVKMLLERQGYKVRVSASSAEAIETINQEPIDLILSDIGLPDESGLEMLKKIRKISNVPAVALSGFGSDEDIQRSHEAGFQEHLTKPFNLQKLRETIAHLLAK